MAQITLNVPDEKEQRFLNAFATVFAWDANKTGMTKRQFMKSRLREYMREILFRAESAEAQRIAVAALQADVDGIDIS